MRRSLCVLVVALAACKPAYHDVTGPFTGTTHRFVVDRFLLPIDPTDFGDDLNGDGRTDDQLREVAIELAGQRYLTTSIDDMLGSGALSPVVEITTDDPALRDDPTVGVRFVGEDGEPGAEMGGSLTGGLLTTNPMRLTHAPASATLHLPLYRHADPLTLPAIGLELDVAADGSGFAGYLRGAWLAPTYLMPAWSGLAQMIAANPPELSSLVRLLDADKDGAVSFDEFTQSGLIENLISPDVQLTDGHGRWAPSRDNRARDSLSFAVGIHLVPCATGSCHAPPASTCDDRATDGDESDVDCGGSCLPCVSGARCRVDADCQIGRCDAGACATPTCSDGVRDGLETDVDCGWNCPRCPSGKHCYDGHDCTTSCLFTSGSMLGTCQ